jgi:WS/DGAT/MGAT family acyltransferase
MRQLNAHDANLLHSDNRHANANLSLIQIYDQSTAPGGKVRFKSILAHIESRLAGLPIFRSKLQRVPLDLDHPYWVDDPNFDIEYHVRHIALPKPGDWRQFCIQASRIHARALDLSRPLWEVYVIEGLDSLLELPVGSFALLTKIHPAAIDAESGSLITRLLHDTSADAPPPAPPEPWFARSAPGPLTLLARSGLNALISPLPPRTPLARRLVDSATAAVVFAGDLLLRPGQVLATRFNSVVSAHRVFDTRRFMLDDFKAIRSLVDGATVNDAVLAVCGGALRRFLLEQGELPDTGLSAATPIYLRAGNADGRAQLSWLRIRLGTELDDARERLALIQRQTAELTASGQALGARELTDIGRQSASATLALSSKTQGLATRFDIRRAPTAACTITNVPGPSVPMYLNGARMSYFSAILPISDGMGLVFAVTSYDGRIIISPTSCRELIPDPEAFTQHLRDSFQEYLAAVRRRPTRAPAAPRSERPGASAPDAPRRKPRTAKKAATVPRAGRAGRQRSATPTG